MNNSRLISNICVRCTRCSIETKGPMHTISWSMRTETTRGIWLRFGELSACATDKLITWIKCSFVILNDRLMRTTRSLNCTVWLNASLIIWEEVNVSHSLPASNCFIRMNCLHKLTTSPVETTWWSAIVNGISNASRI